MPVVLAQARARTCDLYSCLQQACLARAPWTALVHAVVQQYLLDMSTYLHQQPNYPRRTCPRRRELQLA
eukprot:3879325-Pleurochrysis_carterae.AAC.1